MVKEWQRYSIASEGVNLWRLEGFKFGLGRANEI